MKAIHVQPVKYKWIGIIEYSPFNYGVAYCETSFGKEWRHDITMNLSKEEALQHAEHRHKFTGYPIRKNAA